MPITRARYQIGEESGVTFESEKYDRIYFIMNDSNALILRKLELKLKRKIVLTNSEPYEIYGITDLYDIVLIPTCRFDARKLSDVLGEIRKKAEEHIFLHIAYNSEVASPRTYFEIREEYKRVFIRCETSTTFYVCKQIEVTEIDHINEILCRQLNILFNLYYDRSHITRFNHLLQHSFHFIRNSIDFIKSISKHSSIDI